MKLEKHFLIRGVKAVKRFTYKGMTIFIGEGGPFEPENDQQKKEFPTGFFQSVYAIGKDDTPSFYQPLFFDRFHDIKTLTEAGRKQARINAAVKTGKQVVDCGDWNA